LLPAWEALVSWPAFVEVSVVGFSRRYVVLFIVSWDNSDGWGAGVDWGDVVDLVWYVLTVLLLFDNLEGLLVVVLELFWDDAGVGFWDDLFLGADDDDQLEWEATLGTLWQAQPSGPAEDLLWFSDVEWVLGADGSVYAVLDGLD